jgi:pyruvate dehydrogenase E1 component alpha subunit/2-oxoisovalerate dehydrogenase E1 component alpha subunit
MTFAAPSDQDRDIALYRVLEDDGAAKEPTMTPELALRAYREMRRLRAIDARMTLLQRQGRIGFYGAATGQEAVPIATGLVLDPEDWVFSALREQSVMLVRGYPLRLYLGQMFGNTSDPLKGRQPPSHHAGKAVHQVSWSPCIGPQLPQAVGAAWAMKLRKATSIAVGFCGDGATSEPDFHSAMNFAGVFKTPCVLVCQNNHWSISVPTERQTAARTIAVKGRAYGIPSMRVDGNDVFAVYGALMAAVAHARAGKGPYFLECVTYRMGPHTTSDDPSRYRTDAEVEGWKRKDPIERLRRHLVRAKIVDDAFDARLEEEFAEAIGGVIREIEELPQFPRSSMFDDVYAEPPWHLREQMRILEKLPPAPKH